MAEPKQGSRKMKGIILAGGMGTRLSPLTKVISKQLLPVYDKPLVFYPLSTLMLAGIRDIILICAPEQAPHFQKLLGTGASLGVKLSYKIQPKPNGIAESLILAREFLNGESSALILGDNIFHGPSLGRRLSSFLNVSGAQVFGYTVSNPSAYGVATFNESGEVIRIVEKPKIPESNTAIPGIYFFDGKASELAVNLESSSRGELEIIDLLQIYKDMGQLQIEMLPRGTAWFDSGTFSDMHDASTYVRLMEERTGERVGDPFEVATHQGWI
jgi:glucose-1-phosphate thymidylyltransferase